jgi:hypothetical protein
MSTKGKRGSWSIAQEIETLILEKARALRSAEDARAVGRARGSRSQALRASCERAFSRLMAERLFENDPRLPVKTAVVQIQKKLREPSTLFPGGADPSFRTVADWIKGVKRGARKID